MMQKTSLKNSILRIFRLKNREKQIAKRINILKILYFTSVDVSGDDAPAVHVRGTCRALNEKGHKVALLHRLPVPNAHFYPSWLYNIRTARWPRFRGGWMMFQIIASIKLIIMSKMLRPDFIYVRSPTGRILRCALKIARSRVVWEINGLEGINSHATRQTMRICDLALVDSDGMRNEFSSTFPEFDEKIKRHLTFVTDPKCFYPIRKLDATKDLGLSEDTIKVIHVSSFQPWHDFDTMVSAFEGLCDITGPIQFFFIGDGPERANVIRRAREAGLVGAEFPGRIRNSDLHKYINCADVCVDIFSSDRLLGKNLGAYKIYEYMACARPVITAVSDNFSPPDWARDFLYLIKPSSPAELRSALLNVLANSEDWNFKAKEAMLYVQKNQTWSKATDTTLHHLYELMKK
ncbi:glycosyltransferase family 4 protein [Qipengyuania citrea]|uniref:glycosyltransferase family 4 protein n=1 Tax=Qipengyuania citrea TaxID=225971 RepID=UPI00329A51B2